MIMSSVPPNKPHPPYQKNKVDTFQVANPADRNRKRTKISRHRQRLLATRLSTPRQPFQSTFTGHRAKPRVKSYHGVASNCITEEELMTLCEVCEWSTCQYTRQDCAAALKALALIDCNLKLLSESGALSALLTLIASAQPESEMVILQDAIVALSRMLTMQQVRTRLLLAPRGIPCIIRLLRSRSKMTRRASMLAVKNLAISDEAKLYFLSNNMMQDCGAKQGLDNSVKDKVIVKGMIRALLDMVLPPDLVPKSRKFIARSDRTTLGAVAKLIRKICSFHGNRLYFIREYKDELNLILRLAMDSTYTGIQREMMILVVELTQPQHDDHSTTVQKLSDNNSSFRKNHMVNDNISFCQRIPDWEEIVSVVTKLGVKDMLQRNLDPERTPMIIAKLAMKLLLNLSSSSNTVKCLFESTSPSFPSELTKDALPTNLVTKPRESISSKDRSVLVAAMRLIFDEASLLMKYRVVMNHVKFDMNRYMFKAEDAIRLSGLKFLGNVMRMEYMKEEMMGLNIVEKLLNKNFLAVSDRKQITLVANALSQLASIDVPEETRKRRHQNLLTSGVLEKFCTKCLNDSRGGRMTYEIHEAIIKLLANLAHDVEAKQRIADPCQRILDAVIQHHGCLPTSVLWKYTTCLPKLFALLTEDITCAKWAVDAGAIKTLKTFLSPRRRTKEGQVEAARAMANLSCHPEFRCEIVESGILGYLVLLSRMKSAANTSSSNSVLRLYAKSSLKNLAQHAAALRIQVAVRGFLARVRTVFVISNRKRIQSVNNKVS